MTGTDDLAPQFSPRQPPPPYAQGVIKQFDPATFENVIRVHERDLVNLPVKSSVEALTYQEGDTVILARWPGSRQGMASWWIDGRAVIPGTGRGEEAIAFMTTALGAAVAAAVFADRISFASVPTYQSTTSDSYTDLSTVGPTIEGIQVTEAGIMLVMVSAHADATIDTSTGQLNEFTYMSYDIDGPTSRSANDADALLGGFSADPTDGDIAAGVSANATKIVPETGLSAGEYTITAKYKVDATLGGSPSATFGDRTLTVIAF